MVVPEKDMPYLANGMRPDIIVNMGKEEIDEMQ